MVMPIHALKHLLTHAQVSRCLAERRTILQHPCRCRVPQDVRSNIAAESGVSNDLIECHGDALDRLAAPLNGRDASGRVTHAATYVILDGGRQFGTGCGALDTAGAEQALAGYIGRKYTKRVTSGPRSTTEIPVADVLAFYARATFD